MINRPSVILLNVKKSYEKLIKIVKISNYHFQNEKRLLFLVSDKKSQQFIDDFLWREPSFGFLPHGIFPSKDIITISQKVSDDIFYIFNLTPEPIKEISNQIIYEFDDQSDPKKASISKKKFKFYKKEKVAIEER